MSACGPYQPGGCPGQPGWQQPGYGYPGYGAAPSPTEKNWMGNWALGLGLTSLCCSIVGLAFVMPFTSVEAKMLLMLLLWVSPAIGVAAIVFGSMGIYAVNRGRATNKGRAVGGIITAVLPWVGSIILLVLQLIVGLSVLVHLSSL